MGFMELLYVASMPPLQVLIVACLGAFLATEFCGILTIDARKNLNRVVFYVFTPCIIFGNLASTITLDEVVSWWFMPLNIGIIYALGTVLGWIAIKILRPEPYLNALVIASCTAGNYGNLMIIVIPAICNQGSSVFGEAGACRSNAFSYASFSMALGGIYIWTITYSVMKESNLLHSKQPPSVEEASVKAPNCIVNTNETSLLLEDEGQDAGRDQTVVSRSLDGDRRGSKDRLWVKIGEGARKFVEELLAPATCAAFAGLVVGAIKPLKSLIIGSDAPLHVIEDSIKLLGDGTIPSVTLILGGNLTRGMNSAKMRKTVVITIIVVKFVVLPLLGVATVKGAAGLGLLPEDPLFQYTLLMQYTLPPAMNIGTMAELFNAGQEECSVIFLWTYVVAAFALTMWSTVFMWILANA